MTQIHRFIPWGPAVLSPCVHCTLEVGWKCVMAQVAVFPGPCTSDVAGTSETTGWRVGYTILLGPAMAAPAFLQGTQPCALSKLPLPPL